MYTHHFYKNENLSEIIDFIKKNSFGLLLSQEKGRIHGTHLPMEIDQDSSGKYFLTGHIALQNPQGITFEQDQEMMAVFTGPHAYVSSSWYGHENAPTWNYIAVHAYGRITVLKKEELENCLRKLVAKYEQNSENPINYDSLSSRTKAMIKGVIGFKFEIKEFQANYKLSQNRNDADYQNVISHLEKKETSQEKEIAKIMKEKRNLNKTPL